MSFGALAAAHDLVAGQNGREHECAVQRGREDEVRERAEPLVREAFRYGADEEAGGRGEVAGLHASDGAAFTALTV